MRGRCVTWIACMSHCPRAIAEPMLRAALIHLWSLLRRLKQAEGDDRVHWSQLVAMACVLCGRLCPDWKADYVQVDQLLSQAVRASSAVEGVNSVVRVRQRTASSCEPGDAGPQAAVLELSGL